MIRGVRVGEEEVEWVSAIVRPIFVIFNVFDIDSWRINNEVILL